MSGYGVFARFYDALTRDVDYVARAKKMDRLIPGLALQAEQLLDLACGTGGFSFAFADLGYDVTAVDSSAEMLAVAMQKAQGVSRHVLLLQQDMRRLDLYGTVDAAVCALDSLNHLPDERAFAAALEKVALFLAPGGAFLFDLNTRYKHEKVLGNRTFAYETPEVFCVWRNAYQPVEGSVRIELDFFEMDGQGTYNRHTEAFTERLFLPRCTAACLARAGLHLVDQLDGDSFSAPQKKTQRLLYIAQKPVIS